MQLNGVKTAVLIATLSVLMLLVGWGLGRGAGLTIALIVALATNGIAYFFSDRIALHAMRAHPVSEVELPVLFRIVRELSTSARQPMPRLYVSETMQPNAFATGRGPRRAAVCCTRGILELLNERELRAVIGHELSHVFNRDVLIASVAAGIATVITYLSHLAIFLPIGRSEDEDGPGVVGALLMLILGPIAATVIQMAISRTREYQADASGARLTGDPLALASALRKIDVGAQARPLPQDPELAPVSSLMIANPFSGRGLAQMFSTHPPTAERVARLERLAGYAR